MNDLATSLSGETRWTRLQDLFAKVVALPQAECDRYIEEACAGDDVLEQQLRELLTSDRYRGGITLAVEQSIHQTSNKADHTLIGREVGSYRIVRLLGEGGARQ